MRMPRAVANFNRRVTNPTARSLTPWLPCLGTLEHVGRKSGKRYRTPLLVFKSRDGYVILVGYGPETDWLKTYWPAAQQYCASGQSHRVGPPADRE